MDYLIKATAAQGQIRAFAATTKELTEHARQIHESYPVITAALGRTMCAGLMMGSMMKSESDLLSIIIAGDGPAAKITVTADSKGNVKGTAANPFVDLPANSLKKLDVGGAIGKGFLTVIMDTGLKEPYVSKIELVSGEIAEDLTYYYASSEQVPSSVALGVLMNKENTVREAGGFIIQLMPGVSDETIDALEAKLATLPSVTSMLDKGMTPEDILELILGDFELSINDKMPVKYSCNCSRERFARGIKSIAKEDIQSMIDDGQPAEVVCQFCKKVYTFDTQELREFLAER